MSPLDFALICQNEWAISLLLGVNAPFSRLCNPIPLARNNPSWLKQNDGEESSLYEQIYQVAFSQYLELLEPLIFGMLPKEVVIDIIKLLFGLGI